MRLRELIAGIDAPEPADDPSIGGLAYDSREVEPGDLFFCVRGFVSDGHDHAKQAVAAGASALVCERSLGLDVPEVLVEDARRAMAALAGRFFGDPTARLRLVGITGTNGKTTTAYLVRTILESEGVRCGLMGTVERIVGGRREEAVRTTPEAIDLQRTFSEMLEAGDTACAIEVSSHALELGRVEGVAFAVAVFTNLTQDHLDFHPDMEAYFRAKARLFAAGVAARHVVNVDDPYGARLASELGDGAIRTSARGEAEAEISAGAIEFDAAGASFGVRAGGETHETFLPLPGHFNVENALSAIGAAVALGVEPAAAARSLSGATTVAGRFEPIANDLGLAVLVDYAHTPDSLESVLRAARRLTEGRLICVFGCGGDRDQAKRPLMGRAVATHADVAVVTSDNPRSEDPAAIIEQVLAGMDRDGVNVEPDRRGAIELALGLAGEGDTVVIAGKGHEQGQELAGGRKVPFDDRDVAREALMALAEGR